MNFQVAIQQAYPYKNFHIMFKHVYFKKKRNCFFLNFFILTFLSFQLLQANSQAKKSLNPIKNKLFSIHLISGFAQKAILHRTTGEYYVKSTMQPTWELGINLQSNLNEKFFLITGVMATSNGRNVVFDAPVKEINPYDYPDPFPPIKNNQFDFGVSFPFLLEKDWQLNKIKNAFIQTGLNLRFSFGYDIDIYENTFTDTNQQRINVFGMELNSNNQKKPWVSYNFGGGFRWMLKNYDTIKAGIVTNISFAEFVNGTYQVNIPGHATTEGTYGITGSYIAISLSYIFTGINKQFTKESKSIFLLPSDVKTAFAR